MEQKDEQKDERIDEQRQMEGWIDEWNNPKTTMRQQLNRRRISSLSALHGITDARSV